MSTPHPMQPFIRDDVGDLRFKANAIIEWLADTGNKLDLTEIARHGDEFSAEDRMQLAQLLGFSLSGYGDLSYVTGESFAAAARAEFEAGGGTVS